MIGRKFLRSNRARLRVDYSHVERNHYTFCVNLFVFVFLITLEFKIRRGSFKVILGEEDSFLLSIGTIAFLEDFPSLFFKLVR